MKAAHAPPRSPWFGITGIVLLVTALATILVQSRQYALLEQTVQRQDDYLVLNLYQAEIEYLRLREQWSLALAEPGGGVQCFEGEARGTITWPPRGEQGFGYDPIFVPEGGARTFGEMSHDEKLPLTHRARAFEKLLAALR